MFKSIFQKTYVLYFLALVILLNITDFKYVQARRLNILAGQLNYFSGDNMVVGINYWNYRKRLNPNDIPVLKTLNYYYLSAKEDNLSKETMNHILCIDNLDDIDRPNLLKAYFLLTGNYKVNCSGLTTFNFLSKYF